MQKQISIIIITLLSSVLGYSQETGSIEGKILSKDGYPLAGVSIKLGKKPPSQKRTKKACFILKTFQ